MILYLWYLPGYVKNISKKIEKASFVHETLWIIPRTTFWHLSQYETGLHINGLANYNSVNLVHDWNL